MKGKGADEALQQAKRNQLYRRLGAIPGLPEEVLETNSSPNVKLKGNLSEGSIFVSGKKKIHNPSLEIEKTEVRLRRGTARWGGSCTRSSRRRRNEKKMKGGRRVEMFVGPNLTAQEEEGTNRTSATCLNPEQSDQKKYMEANAKEKTKEGNFLLKNS